MINKNPPAKTKLVQKTKPKFEQYLSRFRQAEVYLRLLSTQDLVAKALGDKLSSELFLGVEEKLKQHLEKELEVLFGLASKEASGFDDLEVKALKLLAKSVSGKISTQEALSKTEVEMPPYTPSPLSPDPREEEAQEEDWDKITKDEPDLSGPAPQPKTALVGGGTKNKRKPLTEKWDPENPVVTDGMKKARPKGVKPLPPPSQADLYTRATLQSMAAEQQEKQLVDQHNSGDASQGAPNFDNFSF